MGRLMVEVAQDAGACFGVERALDLVKEAATEDKHVVTLGPLIHNPVVVAELAERGVEVVDSPEEAPKGSCVVLRTHGVPPEVERCALDLGHSVIDATCPFVKKVHHGLARLARDGYDVLVAGEKGHPEVEGTLGYAPGARVVSSVDEAARIELGRRVGLVVQTTLEKDLLASICAVLTTRVEELRVLNTICDATARRQRSAAEVASHSDVVIVVGGKNSANTRHLFDICARACSRAHHIEGADELEPAWFADARNVGLTAGASTPQEHIDAVVRRIEELVA